MRKKVLAIIKQELGEIKEKFADPRRTEFIEEQEEMSDEDYILEEEAVVTGTVLLILAAVVLCPNTAVPETVLYLAPI